MRINSFFLVDGVVDLMEKISFAETSGPKGFSGEGVALLLSLSGGDIVFSLDEGSGVILFPLIEVRGEWDDVGSGVVFSFLVVISMETGGLVEDCRGAAFSLVVACGGVVLSLFKTDGGLVASSPEPNKEEANSMVDDADGVVFSLSEPDNVEVVSIVGPGIGLAFSLANAAGGVFFSLARPVKVEIVSLVEAGGGVVLSLESNEDVVFSLVEVGEGLFLSSLELNVAEIVSEIDAGR